MNNISQILQFFSTAAGFAHIVDLYSQNSLKQTVGLKQGCRILHGFLFAALIIILREFSLKHSISCIATFLFFLKSKDGDKVLITLETGQRERNTTFLSNLGNYEQLESQSTLILTTSNHWQLAFLSIPCVRRAPELASPLPHILK